MKEMVKEFQIIVPYGLRITGKIGIKNTKNRIGVIINVFPHGMIRNGKEIEVE